MALRAISEQELSRCSLIGREGGEGVCVCVHTCVCGWKSDVAGMFTKALFTKAQ